MKFLVIILMSLMSVSSFAALSNENNPHVHCVPLGSPSADDTILLGETGSKSWYVLSVSLLNEAAIAASNSDYVQLDLQKGASTQVAELDSRAAHEDGIAQNAVEPLNVVSAAREIAAGTVIKAVYNETDSGSAVALTGAILCIKYIAK